MKTLPLSKGYEAIVDDADYDWLSQWKWSFCKGYALRRIGPKGQQKAINMHRLILGYEGPLDVDHINGDGLDNRRCNLRLATRGQNLRNGRARPNATGYRGVYIEWDGVPAAAITINGKRKYLGRFKTLEEAARAYDNAVPKEHGEFARLNFGHSGQEQAEG
jgi:hypothetical protein